MKKVLVLFCLISNFTLSQIVNMGSTNYISTCSGEFYDSGGEFGSYNDDEFYSLTICPSTPGSKVIVSFDYFFLDFGFDYLEVYDGPSNGSPLYGVFSGFTTIGQIQASNSNASGCLTFVFSSDSWSNNSGWKASIDCFIPCQNITPIISTTPTSDPDGIIRLCQGESLQVNGAGVFSNSSLGANYTLNFGNGQTIASNSGTTTYNFPGSYIIDLDIVDPNGCSNTVQLNKVVQVSTTPNITLSSSPPTFCLGQSSMLNANVSPNPYTVNCNPPAPGTTFLPDGFGVTYSSSIDINCYQPGLLITSINDINSICLNIEHSFSGDLSMQLTCPNGQSIYLKNYPDTLGSTYLGEANDDGTNTPGIGANYCFTPSATSLLMSGTQITVGSPPSLSISPGNYAPAQSISYLIGCPVNGTWSLFITDNQNIDNGYLFDWALDFNLPQTTGPSFSTTIISQSWVPSSNLTVLSSVNANTSPMATGIFCYDYSVTDNFGCTYVEDICINVNCVPLSSIEAKLEALNKNEVNFISLDLQNNSTYTSLSLLKLKNNNWELIDSLELLTNNSMETYNFIDKELEIGTISYYKVLLKNPLEHEFETNIASCIYDNNDFQVYPNPAKSNISIIGDKKIDSFVLFDLNGKVVVNYFITNKNDKTIDLDVSTLANGMYYLKVNDIPFKIFITK